MIETFYPDRLEKSRHPTKHPDKTIVVEAKEALDAATAELNRFLQTRYLEFFRQQKADPLDMHDSVNLVRTELAKRLERVAAFGQEAVPFLQNLLLDDKGDGSNMPPIFHQTRDEPMISPDGTDCHLIDKYTSGYPYNFVEDAVANMAENCYYDSSVVQWTYRSVYYVETIKAINFAGADAKALLTCLKEVDSFVYLPIWSDDAFAPKKVLKKVGKDISLEEKEQLIRKDREKWKKNREETEKFLEEQALRSTDREKFFKITTKPEEALHTEKLLTDEEEEQYEDEALIKQFTEQEGNISEYSDYGFISRYEDTEFGLPRRAIFEALREKNCDKGIIDYLALEAKFSTVRENFNDIVMILNQDAAYAANVLLKRLNAETDEVYKALITRLLYHLELGKIGVSERVVQYLGKEFDLRESGAQAAFAHRGSERGQVVLFDDQQQALGYFQLHGLDSSEKRLQAEMFEFTYNTLFLEREDETDAERAERLKILDEFKAKYFQTYLTDFRKQTGVAFNNLSFREQGWFLWFVQNASETDKKRALEFIKKYRENGFKTFLALESDRDMGGVLLDMAKYLPQDQGKRLFQDYASISEFADGFCEVIMPHLPSQSGFNLRSLRSKLLARATRFLQLAAEHIRSNPHTTYEQAAERIASERPGLSINSCYEGVVANTLIEMVNAVGDVETRAIFDRVYTTVKDVKMRRALDLAYSFVTPDLTDKKAIHDLQDMYGALKFEEYKVNAGMNEVETTLLADQLKGVENVLDSGCGTGRLLLPLLAKGVKVTGIDYTPRHLKAIKKQNPEAPVLRADWLNNPFANGQFDAVYSLGRNILHESQLSRQQRLFAEANRLLKLDGTFIFDIPDRNQGSYKQLADAYATVMTKRGIGKFRYGTIYDSPDGKLFTTRYAYSRGDIEKIAEDNGFTVVAAEEKLLANGKDDVNVYYTLKKTREAQATVAPAPDQTADY